MPKIREEGGGLECLWDSLGRIKWSAEWPSAGLQEHWELPDLTRLWSLLLFPGDGLGPSAIANIKLLLSV